MYIIHGSTVQWISCKTFRYFLKCDTINRGDTKGVLLYHKVGKKTFKSWSLSHDPPPLPNGDAFAAFLYRTYILLHLFTLPKLKEFAGKSNQELEIIYCHLPVSLPFPHILYNILPISCHYNWIFRCFVMAVIIAIFSQLSRLIIWVRCSRFVLFCAINDLYLFLDVSKSRFTQPPSVFKLPYATEQDVSFMFYIILI